MKNLLEKPLFMRVFRGLFRGTVPLIIAGIWVLFPVNVVAQANLSISQVDVEKEFIEIINFGTDLSLENYHLVYWSKNRSLDNPWRVKKFPENIFLKTNQSMVLAFKDSCQNYDWLVYKNGLLSNNDGAIALYQDDPFEIGFENFVDLRWWGDPLVKNGKELISKSFQEKETLTKKDDFLKIEKPEEFLKLKEGAKVIYESQVIVEPNILSKNFFYVNGIQVYSFYKDFPEIKIGDWIRIKGELSFPYGEPRIKIRDREDIQIINQGIDLPLAKEVSIETISQITPGQLIKVKGQVVERTGDEVYLIEGKGEIVVYLDEAIAIEKKEIEERDFLEVTGILVLRNGDYRIYPRFSSDIVFLSKKNQEKEKEPEIINLDLGEDSDSSFHFSYLFVSFGTLGGILIILLIVEKNKK